MKSAKIIALTITTVSVLIFSFFMIQGKRHLTCVSPLVFNLSGNASFEKRFNEIIVALDGLPKNNIEDVGLFMSRWGGELQVEDESGSLKASIYPVKSWEIDPSSITTTQLNFDYPLSDSSKYSYRFNVHVTYADGDTALMQLSSWGYGTAACPFVASTGTGEPGRLKVLQ